MTRRSDRSRAGAFLLAALLLGLPSACSVKEDRAECPVYVTVLTDRFLQRGLDTGTLSFAAVRLIGRETIGFLSYIRNGYVQACPRDYARVSVLSGADPAWLTDDALVIPQGREAGLVWAYGTAFSANADEYVVDAEPHKQYCLVRFLFDGSPTAPEGYPWRFRLRAECAGMDLYTLEPLPGDYAEPVGPNGVGEWFGVLPRQRTNNMKLEVYLPDPDSPSAGQTEYVVDLGRAFAEQGYDWSLADLKDIEVQVGFTSAEVTLDVREWEHDDHYLDIEI